MEDLPRGSYKSIISYHLNTTSQRINMLKGRSNRKTRAINWIGSAWKWVAGNPDATDWDKILHSTNDIIENNNHQYKINQQLFAATSEVLEKFNNLANMSKNALVERNIERMEQETLQRALLIGGSINEIVRAVQMARNGITNTNLLDKEEISRLLLEIDSLPYTNEVEAIEYGTPTIYCNGSTLLYVLSMPKVGHMKYNVLITKAAIYNNRQVDIEYNKVLANHRAIYGVIADCFKIGNSTICKDNAVTKLDESSCLTTLLRGGEATCTYRTNKNSIIESLKDDIIFVTNFNGTLVQRNDSTNLSGTYIIQLIDETISIGGRTYTTKVSSHAMVLPPVLTNITNSTEKIDIGYLHELSIKNIHHLETLTKKNAISFTINAATFALLVLTCCWVWRKMNKKVNFPALNINPEATTVTAA